MRKPEFFRPIAGSLGRVLCFLMLAGTGSHVHAADLSQYRHHHLSPEQLQELRRSGDILDLEKIIRLIRKSDSDRLLEVELLGKDDMLFYKVQLLESSGIVREYFLDAKTGKAIGTEHVGPRQQE